MLSLRKDTDEDVIMNAPIDELRKIVLMLYNHIQDTERKEELESRRPKIRRGSEYV